MRKGSEPEEREAVQGGPVRPQQEDVGLRKSTRLGHVHRDAVTPPLWTGTRSRVLSRRTGHDLRGEGGVRLPIGTRGSYLMRLNHCRKREEMCVCVCVCGPGRRGLYMRQPGPCSVPRWFRPRGVEVGVGTESRWDPVSNYLSTETLLSSNRVKVQGRRSEFSVMTVPDRGWSSSARTGRQ